MKLFTPKAFALPIAGGLGIAVISVLSAAYNTAPKAEVTPTVSAPAVIAEAPEPAEVSEPTPSFRSSLSYTDQLLYDAAQRQVDECDRNWLPSTCAKMRADFKSEFGWEF